MNNEGCEACRALSPDDQCGDTHHGPLGQDGVRRGCAYAEQYRAQQQAQVRVKGKRMSKTFDMLTTFRTLLAANIPTKLESLPGAGKTSYINALVRASGGYQHTMVAVNHDPTDFGGIPVPNQAEGRYELLPGGWAMDLADSVQTHPVSLLFLDEANTAGRAVLSALLKVVDERRVGNYQLPDSIRIVLAVNPAEANGGVDLTPAMANRVAHLPFVFPERDWLTGLGQGFKDPDPLVLLDESDLTDATRKSAEMVVKFLKVNHTLIERYPDEAQYRSQAFPTRRTWTMGCRAIAAAELLGYGANVQAEVLTTLVSRQVADQFADFLDTQVNLDLDGFFTSPDSTPFPAKDDQLFAVLAGISDRARTEGTQQAIDAACEVFVRVSTELGRPGVAANAVREVAEYLKSHRELLSAPVRMAMTEFKSVIAELEGS